MHSSGGTEEKMKVNDLSAKDYSIEDYFAESKTFLIPRYQRSYAWEKKNIVQLLEDVSKEEGYYIGNVIVNTSQNDEKEIIDGQQRIISIFLILIALHHVAGMNTLEYVLDNGNLKINIEKRIEDSGVSVMSSILDDNIASTMKKYNEVARYKDIASILKKYEENQLETLRKNLLKAKIVEIKFLNGEKRAHEMFVNLNTKGKPLEEIEIIKSHLFKYLIEGENSDQYKEEWYEMLDDIGDKYHGKYLQNISLFKSLTKKKQTAKESLNYLLGEISNEETASSVFGFMAGDENASLFRVYSAVKNHDLLRLKTYIGHEAEISIDMLDQIWKMYGQVKFEQFDVVMVALLYIPSKEKKNLFSKNYLDIIKFLKLVLLFQIHNTVHRVSPSTYTNRFETAAIELYSNQKKIDAMISDLVNDLKINEVTKEHMISGIKSLKCSGKNKNNRDLKIAKFIIQMVDGYYAVDLKAEHIICEKNQDDELVYEIGNILPVVKDRYKDKEIDKKLQMYKEDAMVNVSIKKFLDQGVTEDNYREIIKERTNKIAEEFWQLFEGLRNEKNR